MTREEMGTAETKAVENTAGAGSPELTLVVLAAGAGSRYAGGNKAMVPLGPQGEPLMEYSVYDAVKEGVRRVVFVIRRDMEEALAGRIRGRMDQHADVRFVFPEEKGVPEIIRGRIEGIDARTKPWGTAFSLCCALEDISGPFAVINADDWYGPEAFRQIREFLTEGERDGADRRNRIGMVGYPLRSTVTENGWVTRGICAFDEEGRLNEIEETRNIVLQGEEILCGEEPGARRLHGSTVVSMNMWGMFPQTAEQIREHFPEFLQTMPDPAESEFLLPEQISLLLEREEAQADVMLSQERWFGITYEADIPQAKRRIEEMIREGVYPEQLF